MTKTIKIEVTVPEPFYRAAKHICEAFNYTLDEYMTDALRGELQCSFGDSFTGVSEELRDRMAKEVRETLGEELSKQMYFFFC